MVIEDITQGVQTRSKLNYMTQITFISLIKPKNIKEACADNFWTIAIQEELNQFVRNDVWDLVQRPTDHLVLI